MKTNEAPETYPMQFRDKIDEYLWKEHHIIDGCCSSIESLKYAVAREVAEKLTDVFIEKLECWINENFYQYAGEFAEGILAKFDKTEDAIDSFKNYMKGE